MAAPIVRPKSLLLSPVSMGQANRSRVLELLHQNGPSSRAQLARALNVNRATIASILQPLVDNETLVEGEQVPPTAAGGKPARPLWFNRNGKELGSMRLAARAVTAARLGMDGTVHSEAQAEIDPEQPVEIVQDVLLKLAAHLFHGRPLLGIGIAASGMVDTAKGVIISMNLAPVWNGYPLGTVLQDRFQVPVTVDHHPRVQALGDRWFGHGRRIDTFASVYTGEALGMGIFHDGRIIRGAAGAGGEYGHVVVDMRGDRCICGRRGCWETVASLSWLRREAARRGIPDPETVACHRLSAQADAGHRPSAELLDLYAHNLALGMANNEYMLGSGTYIVHGDAAAGGERMRALLQRWVAMYEPQRGTPATVILGGSSDEMALLGGGGLILSTELASSA